MRHLLIDFDSTIPNLALMKISAWAKSRGDQVYLNDDSVEPDEIWLSCLFTWNANKAKSRIEFTIGSRQGDTVLDPFMGSGTTGVACRLLNRDFIGYEIEGKYFEIAEKRINSKPNQLTIEDFTDDKIPQTKEVKE